MEAREDPRDRESHQRFLRTCLELASRGRGRTSPNPMVGAVVVKGGRVLGEGFHAHAGAPHAEVMALRRAGDHAKGADLYVNLEPCCHFGRTPPCVEEIIRHGVRTVFACCRDPDPRVDGRGFQVLRGAGVRVEEGLLKEEALRLNERFAKFVRTGRPFVLVKGAMSLDGKIATSGGESSWITGEESRRLAHALRFESDGVMVGIRTILRDDPRLTVRIPEGEGKGIARVILDSRLRCPASARVLGTRDRGPVLIYTTRRAPPERIRRLEGIGARVVLVEGREDRVSLPAVLEDLGRRKITSVLLEGGGELIGTAFREHLVDKLVLFLAPLIIGGSRAPGLVQGDGFRDLSRCPRLRDLRVLRVGEDIVVEGYPQAARGFPDRRSAGEGRIARAAGGPLAPSPPENG